MNDIGSKIAEARHQLLSGLALGAAALTLTISPGTAAASNDTASPAADQIARVRGAVEATMERGLSVALPAYIAHRPALLKTAQSTTTWNGNNVSPYSGRDKDQ